MWAAYQGDALSVDLLLKHGANPNLKDDTGLSPLHWAVVRGNRVCIRRLLESGADIGAKDNEGRTARDMAVELKSLGAWKRALEEGGLNEEGIKKKKPLSEVCLCLTPHTLHFNDLWRFSETRRLPYSSYHRCSYGSCL